MSMMKGDYLMIADFLALEGLIISMDGSNLMLAVAPSISHPPFALRSVKIIELLCSTSATVIVFTETEVFEPFTHTQLQFLRIEDTYFGSIEELGLSDAVSLPNPHAPEACYLRPWPHEEFQTFDTVKLSFGEPDCLTSKVKIGLDWKPNAALRDYLACEKKP
ncbi:hypothetical protein EDB19DRAFT_125985 [Suillus lakei]|nr:hypothetical protein EDB19DRAFT_125985 [Suillus lakei]